MNERALQPLHDHEFDPLTDSLVSRVRWRVSDYEAIFRAEIDLMLGVDEAAPHGGPAPSRETRP